ncbi:MAG: AMP-binding protein [Verrucomicrobia bacterium]|nr:AMP-binding protein [Verrucomicrobiota bacterium]
MIAVLLRSLAQALLRLRYRIEVTGLKPIAARGNKGILFLPNHPALIDPPIVIAGLHKHFAPRVLADKDQVDRVPLRWVADIIGVHVLPDPAKYGDTSRTEVGRVLKESSAILKRGENLLLYPAGHLYHSYLEHLGGNSAVESILKELPDVRVVLIRTRGLWGSSFSRASGTAPDLIRAFKQGLLALLANGIFFSPRRHVSIELAEPEDLPRREGRTALNRFMENYYNQDAPHNIYVPYTRWGQGGPRVVPEPPVRNIEGDVESVPAATRAIVLNHLKELTGKSELKPDEKLAGDLGLDSLARVELFMWLEKEFGFQVGEDVLETVGDVLLAACGNIAATGPGELKPVPPAWFKDDARSAPFSLPEGKTIMQVFLEQAARQPGRVVLADQTGGIKTYRDIITAILALKPEIEKLSGDYVGIMLPASAGAATIYFATLFAGKIPVMVNWTVGSRNIVHSLDLLGVRHVLTAGALAQKIESQGTNLGQLKDRFVMLEEVGQRITTGQKLKAALMSRLSWRALARVKGKDTAVVLFTSGSESRPKAVPLTHTNILSNIRDFMKVFHFQPRDRLLGMLPPFHSFGLTVTICFPLCVSVRTVYHPNPTEGGTLARMIAAYKVSLLVSTPTFLNGILRGASDQQLQSLRAVISGAEKCPTQLYETVARRLPHLVLLEGYGITECSPAVSFNDEKAPRPQTIGKVVPSVQYALVDLESGRRVAPLQVGMLLVRGPGIFNGYLNYDGASPFVEFEGKPWYRTGDLISEDADGVLTFAGRLKRFVKLGGEMISLPAIEEVLARFYVGLDDEGPVIAVESTPVETNPELVLFTVKDLDREKVNQQIRAAGLSALYNIRSVVKLDEIPTLGTGKTNYHALKEMLKAGQMGVTPSFPCRPE